jgi:NhaC family Na+:H+ antiporter
VLARLIAPVIRVAKSVSALVSWLVAAVFATNVITADQYIGVVLPGRMFKSAFQQRGLAPLMLSRTIAAAGTPTSALIPWNSCGAYMAGALGVATLHYLPYAVFNLASPLLAIAVTATGLRVLHAAPQAGGTEVSTPLARWELRTRHTGPFTNARRRIG